MTVTVVVPTYNNDIEPTLKALKAQTVSHRLIVVDNGSANPPVDLVAHYGGELLHESQPGSYAARNRALAEINSGIVAFTDADCIPAPDWLAVATADLGQEIVVGDVINRPRDPKPTIVERYEMLRGFPIRDYAKQGYGVTANLVTRREVIDKVGPFDASLKSSGDKEFCQRARKAGITVRFVPEAVVHHPARRRFSELSAKYRRIEGGEFTRDSKGRRWRALIQKWILWPFPPVFYLLRLRRQGYAPRWRDVVLIGWVLQGLRWVRATERTRLCFGATARR